MNIKEEPSSIEAIRKQREDTRNLINHELTGERLNVSQKTVEELIQEAEEAKGYADNLTAFLYALDVKKLQLNN